MQQVVKRATKVNIALGGLRHPRPEQMRQLYGSTKHAWHRWLTTHQQCGITPSNTKRIYNYSVDQRATLIRILSAFRTVATQTLEVEAHVWPTNLRLTHHAKNISTRLHTFPEDHNIRDVLLRAEEIEQHWLVTSVPIGGSTKDNEARTAR